MIFNTLDVLPLLSLDNLNASVSSSAGGTHLDQVLFNSAGIGWNANDLSVVQSNVNVEEYWIQVQFTQQMKIFYIDLQQDFRGAKGFFWIKYGQDESSLQAYTYFGEKVTIVFIYYRNALLSHFLLNKKFISREF